MLKAESIVIGFKKWKSLPSKKNKHILIKASKFEKGLSNFVDRTLRISFDAFKT
jgi:hypothetical protein